MVGQVVADQGVEQVGVVVEVGGGDARRAADPWSWRRCFAARARNPAGSAGSSVTSAAATSSAGESFVLAQSRISPAAVSSPPISRRSKTSMSMGHALTVLGGR